MEKTTLTLVKTNSQTKTTPSFANCALQRRVEKLAFS